MTQAKRIRAGLMALVLVGSVLAGPASVVSAQQGSSVTVSQTAQGATTVAPGETLTVDVTVETTASGAPAIELAGVPAGWDVQAVENDGGTFQSTNYEWFWIGDTDIDGDYSHTVTYEVTVPAGASDGTYAIDAVGSSQGSDGVDDDYEDTDTLSLDVQSTQQNQPPTADAGADLTVDEGAAVVLDASGSSDPDAGDSLSYAWSVADDAGTGVSLSDAGTETPEFTAPEVSGEATLTFEVSVDDGSASAADTVAVTVQDADTQQPGGVSVSQTAQGATTVAPGETLTVDVTVETTASGAPAIELAGVPAGWDVQAVENDGGAFQPTNYEWFWNDADLDGDYSHTVTYEVTVPAGASDGTYAIDAVGSSQGSDGVDDDYEDTDTLSLDVQSTASGSGSAEISVTPGGDIDASTYGADSFQIENVGEQEITSVTFDLSTAALPDVVFDPSGEAGDQGAKGFTPDSGAGSVGLVDGSVSEPHNGQNNDEGYDKLTVTFDDFEPDESFAFSVDNDPVSIKGAGGAQSSEAGPISGLELAGATVTVEYADGTSQRTSLFGDGSDGGSVAAAKDDVPQAPTITDVQGVTLDPTALDARHGAATVSEADQTVTVSGPAGGTVRLLRIEGSLNLVDAPGYELEPFEANRALQVAEQTVDLGADGQATVDVTLTDSTASVVSDDAGYNYLLAALEDGDGDAGLTSNTVVLEYDQDAVQPPTGDRSAAVSITPGGDLEASTYAGGAFTVENTGEQEITSVSFDLSTTTLPDMVFDPEGTAGDQAGKGLSVDSESGDGVGVVSTADDDVFSQPHDGQDGADGYDVLTVQFSDFEPGETVAFSADNDPTTIKDATITSQEAGPVSGLELARATVEVGYADGTTQTTQTVGDGSDGGAEAVADADVPAAPSIDVQGVTLDATALDARHAAATVDEASQTVTVTGPAGADVTLVRVEGELELDNVPSYGGTPGYEVEDYEANKAESAEYDSVTLDSNGQATVPVDLTKSTDAGGYNYLVAAVEDADGPGLSSDVVVLKLEPDDGPAPVGDFENAPTDPDGDGVYEDVNGDGTPNVNDAQALFANLDDPVVQAGDGTFDFNDDGSVNVNDAQALFAELTGGS